MTELWPREPGAIHALGSKLCHRRLAHSFLEGRLDGVHDAVVADIEGAARLIDGDARPEPGEDVGPVAAAIAESREIRLERRAQRDRHEHLRPRADGRAREPTRRDADDREALAVDDQRVVQHGRVRPEPRAPVVVAENHDAGFANRTIVAGVEQPAERGHEAEHLKVAARHEHASTAERLTL